MALGRGRSLRAEPPEGESEQTLPRRPLGRTGFQATIFGLGCFPLGGIPDDDQAVEVIVKALDAGCNVLDTAPSYARGRGETRVGKAIKGRPRSEIFLATKTHTRTADDARRDLEASLGRLGVDRVDLIQVHAVSDAADLDRVLGRGGPIPALVKAREEGTVRFIGVTGHADPIVMRTAVERWPFDAIMLPLNCVDPHHLSFEKETLPTAVRKGLARMAMKVFASGNLVEKGIDAESCLRYVYGLDVSTVLVGCRTLAEVDLAVRVARENATLDAKEKAALLQRTMPFKGKGVEWYKRA